MLVINYIVNNYAMLFELVGLLIVLRVSIHLSEPIRKQTRLAVILLIAETLIFTLEAWTQTFSQMSLLRPMLTACLYSIYPVILICMMQITSTEKLTRRGVLLLLIPEIVSIPFYFTSQWSHLICWYSEDNHYLGGPFYRWPYLIFGFYAIVLLIRNLRYFKKYERSNRLVMLYIVIGPLAGVVLALLLGGSYDWGALFTSAILVYFLCIYIHMSKIDPLTKLLNRQCFYDDVRKRDGEIKAVISAALEAIARVLETYCGSDSTTYRVGGDEFLILSRLTEERRVADTVAAMRKKLSETPYRCAFGYAMRKPEDTVQDLICAADDAMFADKAAMQRAMPTREEAPHFGV